MSLTMAERSIWIWETMNAILMSRCPGIIISQLEKSIGKWLRKRFVALNILMSYLNHWLFFREKGNISERQFKYVYFCSYPVRKFWSYIVLRLLANMKYSLDRSSYNQFNSRLGGTRFQNPGGWFWWRARRLHYRSKYEVHPNAFHLILLSSHFSSAGPWAISSQRLSSKPCASSNFESVLTILHLFMCPSFLICTGSKKRNQRKRPYILLEVSAYSPI